jgi:hypothetical protein
MILYEGNVLEVGVASWVLYYITHIVKIYDRAVIIYILLILYKSSLHQDYHLPHHDQNFYIPNYPYFPINIYIIIIWKIKDNNECSLYFK